MLEVWDKYSPSNDVLLGLVKLPLKIFSLSLKGALWMEFGLLLQLLMNIGLLMMFVRERMLDL